MQTQLYSLLKDIIKSISPLLYTGLGGFISYKSSCLIESRKEKRKQNLEKLNNVLIPLYECIEEIEPLIKTLSFEIGNFEKADLALSHKSSPIQVSNKNIDSYTQIKKRMYLTSKIIDSLNCYRKYFKNLDISLDKISKNLDKFEKDKLIYDINKLRNLLLNKDNLNNNDISSLLYSSIPHMEKTKTSCFKNKIENIKSIINQENIFYKVNQILKILDIVKNDIEKEINKIQKY